MTMLGPTGAPFTPLEMLAAQIRGLPVPTAGGPVSMLSGQGGGLGIMGQGVGNITGASQFLGARPSPIGIAARTAVPGGGAMFGGGAGGAMGGGGLGGAAQALGNPARGLAGGAAGLGGAGGAGAEGLTGILGRAGGLAKGANWKAAGLRGGLAGAAASFAVNPLIEMAVPGKGGQAEGTLKGAASGALLGGAIGSVFPGPGTLVGALVGGGGGALLSFIKPGKAKTKGLEELKDAMADANIDPQTGAFILHRYSTMLKLAENDEEKAQAYDEAKNLLINAIAPADGSMGQAPQAWTPEQIMAMQAQSAELMRPVVAESQRNAQAHAQLIGQLTQGMDPGVANLLRGGAAGEITASQRLMNAYQAQAQLAPIAAMWERQTQYRDQISNQLLQQAMGQVINPQTQASASPLSLDSLGL